MMSFVESTAHSEILGVVRDALESFGYKALRADTQAYCDDLWPNVCVYMLGCKRGLAIFEQMLARDLNPSVSMEVGFMLALGKQILLLKDIAISALPTDLLGKLYRPFDGLNPSTIRPQIEAWIREF